MKKQKTAASDSSVSRPEVVQLPAWSEVASVAVGWLSVCGSGDSSTGRFIFSFVPNTVATMFEEASEVFDNMFKSSFPLTFIVFIPAVLILVSPLPAEASHEFTVYRMQQYDLQGQPYGKVAASLAYLSQKSRRPCVKLVRLGSVSDTS